MTQTNNISVCQCTSGYTGNPFNQCFPLTNTTVPIGFLPKTTKADTSLEVENPESVTKKIMDFTVTAEQQTRSTVPDTDIDIIKSTTAKSFSSEKTSDIENISKSTRKDTIGDKFDIGITTTYPYTTTSIDAMNKGSSLPLSTTDETLLTTTASSVDASKSATQFTETAISDSSTEKIHSSIFTTASGKDDEETIGSTQFSSKISDLVTESTLYSTTENTSSSTLRNILDIDNESNATTKSYSKTTGNLINLSPSDSTEKTPSSSVHNTLREKEGDEYSTTPFYIKPTENVIETSTAHSSIDETSSSVLTTDSSEGTKGDILSTTPFNSEHLDYITQTRILYSTTEKQSSEILSERMSTTQYRPTSQSIDSITSHNITENVLSSISTVSEDTSDASYTTQYSTKIKDHPIEATTGFKSETMDITETEIPYDSTAKDFSSLITNIPQDETKDEKTGTTQSYSKSTHHSRENIATTVLRENTERQISGDHFTEDPFLFRNTENVLSLTSTTVLFEDTKEEQSTTTQFSSIFTDHSTEITTSHRTTDEIFSAESTTTFDKSTKDDKFMQPSEFISSESTEKSTDKYHTEETTYPTDSTKNYHFDTTEKFKATTDFSSTIADKSITSKFLQEKTTDSMLSSTYKSASDSATKIDINKETMFTTQSHQTTEPSSKMHYITTETINDIQSNDKTQPDINKIMPSTESSTIYRDVDGEVEVTEYFKPIELPHQTSQQPEITTQYESHTDTLDWNLNLKTSTDTNTINEIISVDRFNVPNTTLSSVADDANKHVTDVFSSTESNKIENVTLVDSVKTQSTNSITSSENTQHTDTTITEKASTVESITKYTKTVGSTSIYDLHTTEDYSYTKPSTTQEGDEITTYRGNYIPTSRSESKTEKIPQYYSTTIPTKITDLTENDVIHSTTITSKIKEHSDTTAFDELTTESVATSRKNSRYPNTFSSNDFVTESMTTDIVKHYTDSSIDKMSTLDNSSNQATMRTTSLLYAKSTSVPHLDQDKSTIENIWTTKIVTMPEIDKISIHANEQIHDDTTVHSYTTHTYSEPSIISTMDTTSKQIGYDGISTKISEFTEIISGQDVTEPANASINMTSTYDDSHTDSSEASSIKETSTTNIIDKFTAETTTDDIEQTKVTKPKYDQMINQKSTNEELFTSTESFTYKPSSVTSETVEMKQTENIGTTETIQSTSEEFTSTFEELTPNSTKVFDQTTQIETTSPTNDFPIYNRTMTYTNITEKMPDSTETSKLFYDIKNVTHYQTSTETIKLDSTHYYDDTTTAYNYKVINDSTTIKSATEIITTASTKNESDANINGIAITTESISTALHTLSDNSRGTTTEYVTPNESSTREAIDAFTGQDNFTGYTSGDNYTTMRIPIEDIVFTNRSTITSDTNQESNTMRSSATEMYNSIKNESIYTTTSNDGVTKSKDDGVEIVYKTTVSSKFTTTESATEKFAQTKVTSASSPLEDTTTFTTLSNTVTSSNPMTTFAVNNTLDENTKSDDLTTSTSVTKDKWNETNSTKILHTGKPVFLTTDGYKIIDTVTGTSFHDVTTAEPYSTSKISDKISNSPSTHTDFDYVTEQFSTTHIDNTGTTSVDRKVVTTYTMRTEGSENPSSTTEMTSSNADLTIKPQYNTAKDVVETTDKIRSTIGDEDRKQYMDNDTSTVKIIEEQTNTSEDQHTTESSFTDFTHINDRPVTQSTQSTLSFRNTISNIQSEDYDVEPSMDKQEPTTDITTNTRTTYFRKDDSWNKTKFTVVPDTDDNKSSTEPYLDEHMKHTEHQFDISTDRYDVDHPLSSLLNKSCSNDKDCSANKVCTDSGCSDPCIIYKPCPQNVSCVVIDHSIMCLCTSEQMATEQCNVTPGKTSRN